MLRAALGDLGRRSLTPPRPCSAAYSSTGSRPAAPCSVGREGCVTEAAPHPRLGEQVLRRGPSAGRLLETSAGRQSAQGRPADRQLPGRGVAAPSGQGGRALLPTDARGGREVGVARLECLWGPGLGVPGPWGPLPPREGPGPLQWQNAPTSAPPARPAAERELTGGCEKAVWSQPGCERGLPLGLGFQIGKGMGEVGGACLSDILGQSFLFLFL